MIKDNDSVNVSVKAYFLIGFYFISPCLFSQNQKVADSLIAVFQTQQLELNQKFEVLRGIAANHINPDIGLQYANKLISLSEKEEEFVWLYRGYLQQGNAYKLKGNLSLAVESFFKSLKAAQRADYTPGIGGAYLSVGDTYANNNDHENGIKYRNRAIEILRTTEDSVTLATALLNTGYEYYLIDGYDSALAFYKESGRIFENKDFVIGKAYNLGNSGLVYAKQGDNKLAESQIREAISILESFEDSYAITEFEIEMASIYQQKSELREALKYAESAMELALKDGLKKRIRDASLKLSELHADLGDFEKAFSYQSQYIAYRDSINNEETIRKMADLRTEYEVSQKQAEVDLLNEQKRNQQLIGAGLTAVLLLAGALAFTFYRNNKEKQRVNLILSEQKEEIEAQRDQLDELNKSKDKFFSIISHDLRGPVHAFKGMSRLIKMYIDQNSIHELAEINEHFDNSVDQLSTLLDDLLEWAVAQQGNVPYNPEKVKLNAVADELIGLFNNMARAKKIELIAEVPDDLMLWADLNSIRTILRNLLNNALKFTPEGGWIKLSAARAGERGEVKVEDTGIGIARDKLETLFKLAGHKRSWGTEGEKGLGLGLQLVYEFSKMNGGEVRVESEEGKGTSFTLVVPVYRGEPVPSAQT
ncbi:hypothetical protein C900_05613 [Fulvivirga imtechensis AK7]|uniref:histidine kinase n=1 Tax=Fulvivirga imtechensis AK7 TaxID=1237149 RepID=L8JJE4_9BACT|nr:tetratricopeptide repeat-containing sensor histidine kinase [Fulvivirga imtechensis]ELR68920.1 hypothetical protein C900_05613 [Fulvivirga imtechensis AK7]